MLLFVSVCVPARVATVLSILRVTVLPVALESRPVPPATVSVSLSRSIAIVPESVVISRSCAVTCASTYALMDCCVAKWLALSEVMSSSSLMDVPEIVPFSTAEVRVLLVRVSVVARPTTVSVLVGRVSVPVLLMLLMTGAVSVLLVSV